MSYTIIVVPGAWPVVSFFDPFIKALESHNHRVICRIPSSYPPFDRDAAPTSNWDADFFRSEILEPVVESGEDVVVFMYSYGAVYGAESLQGLTKEERQSKGLKGGIIAVLLNAGFIAPEGTMALTSMGIEPDNLPEWIEFDFVTGRVDIARDYAKAVYFNELPEEEADRLANVLPSHPASCFMVPTHWDPYRDPYYQGKMGFIMTGADRVFPIQIQHLAVQQVGITHTHLLENASHSPHLEDPEKLAKVVINMVEEITTGGAASKEEEEEEKEEEEEDVKEEAVAPKEEQKDALKENGSSKEHQTSQEKENASQEVELVEQQSVKTD